MAGRIDFDGVVVVGSGLAGLTAALAAAPRPVLLLSAGALGDQCASAWAQGGMAAALADDDSPALHAADTLAAGAGLCDPAAVELLTREGPAAVRALAALGAPFDRAADGRFVQGLEAAHSRARIARVGGDGAGAAIMAAVVSAVRASPSITVLEHARVSSLLCDADARVCGVLRHNYVESTSIHASAVVLATGGVGGLYAVTTNPAGARGEGLAMAALAGAEILDPEFVQFHPTAIDVGLDPAPLATEALRGEGAVLIDQSGNRFVDELAARDVVARAIANQARLGPVFLDTREAIGEGLVDRFPAVFAACMAAGLDPRTAPIPVTPAAHYHMGGVATDLWGRTSLEGFFAVGECAATGVHGANRLASNSLVEAAVFGARAGQAAAGVFRTGRSPRAAPPPAYLPAPLMGELRRRMSADAGVVRSASSLGALAHWIETRRGVIGDALPLVAASLIVEAALGREESRGAHFRSDFPATAERGEHSRVELQRERQRETAAA